MTRGFYEQIGVAPDADLDEVKAAYGRAVAHLLKRREAAVAAGGDAAQLDLARAQLDEAWEVLSDPARRRRYDAMLAVAGDGIGTRDLEDLWARVAGAMIHPSVSSAARIVDAATSLELSPLPEPPRPHVQRRAGGDAFVEAPTPPPITRPTTGGFGPPRVAVARTEPAAPAYGRTTPGVDVTGPVTSPGPSTGGAEVVPLRVTPPLRVVQTREEAGTVLSLPVGSVPAAAPPPVPTSGGTASGDVDQLVDQLGHGGALLRAVRERKGITLQQMADSTRISVRYLEAVEREDFGALPPAAAFVRGYVREMSRLLGLDVDRVVAGYMRRFSSDA